MFVGQLGAKFLSFFGTLVAVRSLGPAEIGNAGIVLAAAGILGVLTGMGVDVIGPRLVNKALDAAKKKEIAIGLFALRGLAASTGMIFLPLYVISHEDSSLLSTAVIGGLLMIANSLGPQFAFQGFGIIDRFPMVQIGTSLIAVPAFLLVAFCWPKAEGFLLAQTFAGIIAFFIGSRILGILPISWPSLNLGETARSLFSREGRSAWLGNIAIFGFAQGDVLSVSLFCGELELGNFNAALTVVSAANSLLLIVPTVIYTRQIKWICEGTESFRRKQARLLCVVFWSSIIGAVVTATIAIPLSRVLLGPSFETAPVISGVILAVALFNTTYSVMVAAINALGKSWKNVHVTLLISALAVFAYPFSAKVFGIEGVLAAKCMLIVIMTCLQFVQYKKVIVALTNLKPE